MKYEVKRRFKLKPANKRYRRGEIFETQNGSLAEQLKAAGWLGKRISEPKAAPKIESKPVQVVQLEPVSLGGGWYQLPDGRKVRKSQIEDSDDAT